MTGIPEWVGVTLLGIIGTVAWWGIRRIISGQDQANQTLTDIKDEIGQWGIRVTGLETWRTMHERSDDERYEQLEKQTDSLWTVVRGK